MAVDATAKLLGVDVPVVPSSGDPAFVVKAWPAGETELFGAVSARTQRGPITLLVRVSDWATPLDGDRLTILGEERVVSGSSDHADALRLVWMIETEEAA